MYESRILRENVIISRENTPRVMGTSKKRNDKYEKS